MYLLVWMQYTNVTVDVGQTLRNCIGHAMHSVTWQEHCLWYTSSGDFYRLTSNQQYQSTEGIVRFSLNKISYK